MTPPVFYFAGKVKPDCWRVHLTGHQRVMSLEPGTVIDLGAGITFRYGGPNALSCDHGCWHSQPHGLVGDEPLAGTVGPDDTPQLSAGIQAAYEHFPVSSLPVEELAGGGCPISGGGLTPQGAVMRCLEQIEKADAVVAFIESADAHGTITELGFAAALGKPIFLTLAPQLQPRPGEKDELWFVKSLPTIQAVNYAGAGFIHPTAFGSAEQLACDGDLAAQEAQP